MDIARVVRLSDIEQTVDPTRPHGHVTILPETCQMTLQALKSRYDVLSQVYKYICSKGNTRVDVEHSNFLSIAQPAI